jgi:hypothetical protein
VSNKQRFVGLGRLIDTPLMLYIILMFELGEVPRKISCKSMFYSELIEIGESLFSS